jgi:hypothetical protein
MQPRFRLRSSPIFNGYKRVFIHFIVLLFFFNAVMGNVALVNAPVEIIVLLQSFLLPVAEEIQVTETGTSGLGNCFEGFSSVTGAFVVAVVAFSLFGIRQTPVHQRLC